MRRLAVALLLVGMSMTGCVTVPRPIAATEAPRPALTVTQAGAEMTRIRAGTTKADQRQSAEVAATVLTGHELAAAAGSYTLTRQLGHRHTYDLEKLAVRAVHSGPAATYPQQAVVVAAYADPKQKKWTVLAWLTRVDAGSPWRLGLLAPVRTDRLPALAPPSTEGVSTFLPDDETVGGTRLVSVSALVGRAVNVPRSEAAQQFRKSPRGAHFGDFFQGHRAHLTSRLTVGPRSSLVALPTATGGALVLADGGYDYSRRADDDFYFTFTGGEPTKRYRGEYLVTTDTGLLTYVVAVPPSGRLDLVGVDRRWTGFSVVDNPGG